MSATSKSEGDLFTAAQVATAAVGQLVQGDPDVGLAQVVTDSRQPAPGALFVALRGERFDGSTFCANAVDNGARAVLIERDAWDAGRCGPLGDAAVIVVPDCLRALGDLAGWHRRRFPARLVAVTGSNGKTSTKEMIAAVLGGAPDVLFNRGNFNNLIGMPRALLGLTAQHRYAVMEMGMNAPGEIARLAELAGPQIGVITNVHPVHLEGLGSIQAVAEAKGELLEAVPGDGAVVLNADDPYVLQQAERTRALRVTFGQSPAADVRLEKVEQRSTGLTFILRLPEGEIEVELARLGMHNAVNAAAAAAVGSIEGLAPEQIAERLARAPAPPMRMEVVRIAEAGLLVDCYNANPRSVQAALGTLAQLPAKGPRLAILGDMLELGNAAESLHRQVGRQAAEAGLDGLCAFGRLSAATAEAAREAGLSQVAHTEDIDEATDWARERIGPGVWLLLKGSRGMRLERIGVALAKENGVAWGEEH